RLEVAMSERDGQMPFDGGPELPQNAAQSSNDKEIEEEVPEGGENHDEYEDDVRESKVDLPLPDYPRPLALVDREEFIWDEDELPQLNYPALGQRLAAAGDLYRHPGYANGLL